jgi:uncharacterized protein involved in exopolysaccharide biosynthesis
MQNETTNTAIEEISLREIKKFFRRNAQLILFFGMAGLALSIIMLILKPTKFEAKMQLQMAQYEKTNLEVFSNIETPAALIQRLRSALVYPDEVQRICAMPEGVDLGEYLNGIVKIEPSKVITNVVEIRVEGPSLEIVQGCSEALVAMIVAQQRGLIEERLVGLQAQLTRYRQAYQEEFQQLEKIRKADLSNFAYLDKVNKLSWLRTRIDELQEEAVSSFLRPAKLIVPMSLPKQPVSKKAFDLLLLGALLGLFLGVLNTLVREGWRKAA